MARFDYLAPTSLEEALQLLRQHEEVWPIAGGSDLLIAIQNGKATPRHVLDLKRLKGLDGIRSDGEWLVIGALATLNAVIKSPLVANDIPVLAQAANTVASCQVRNWATIGGNLCNAAPSADTAPALLVLEAKAVASFEDGQQEFPIREFFTGPGTTVLGKRGILTAIRVPVSSRDGRAIYLRHCLRKSMDIAVVGVAVWLQMDGPLCREARIGLGAVAPTPIRASRAEAALQGRALDRESINRAARLAADECQPISDIRASAQYRREMVRVYTRRALDALVPGGGAYES